MWPPTGGRCSQLDGDGAAGVRDESAVGPPRRKRGRPHKRRWRVGHDTDDATPIARWRDTEIHERRPDHRLHDLACRRQWHADGSGCLLDGGVVLGDRPCRGGGVACQRLGCRRLGCRRTGPGCWPSAGMSDDSECGDHRRGGDYVWESHLRLLNGGTVFHSRSTPVRNTTVTAALAGGRSPRCGPGALRCGSCECRRPTGARFRPAAPARRRWCRLRPGTRPDVAPPRSIPRSAP